MSLSRFGYNRPIRVAVFGSGTGTILRAMLSFQKRAPSSPFCISLLYTDRVCGFQGIAREENIPLIHHPQDRALSRKEYDERGLALLSDFCHRENTSIDFILLAGYMRLMTEAWLNAFPRRIINIHPADLTHLDTEGNRKFIGANAVFEALVDGQARTRTCAILIDPHVDTGPILISGPWVDYQNGYPITREKALQHQDRQKKTSDWPTCLAALVLLGQQRLKCIDDALVLDGEKLPPGGYDINEEKDVWNYWDL